jgi:FixJ family two-component response regulator
MKTETPRQPIRPINRINPILAVIDDDESVRAALRSLLRSFGFEVELFPSAEDFLALAWADCFACLIVDIRMPGMSGLDLLRQLLAEGYRVPTIIMTAIDDPTAQRRAIDYGAEAFLRKPFAEDHLIAAVQSALEAGEGARP